MRSKIASSINYLLYFLSYSTYFVEYGYRTRLPHQESCGRFASPKIVRGEDAPLNSYPWMISMRLASEPSGHFCGATLIYAQYAITAAHCVAGFEPREIVLAVNLLYI